MSERIKRYMMIAESHTCSDGTPGAKVREAEHHLGAWCLSTDVAAIEAERDEAFAKLDEAAQGKLVRLNMETGRIDATLQGGFAVKALAASFGDYFRQIGATNFLTVDVCDTITKPDEPLWMSVVIQRKGGKSPADKLKESDDENARLRRIVEAAGLMQAALVQCRGALKCDAMVTTDGAFYGTTLVALGAADDSLAAYDAAKAQQ